MTPERVREIWYASNPSGICLPDAAKAISEESQREIAEAVEKCNQEWDVAWDKHCERHIRDQGEAPKPSRSPVPRD